MATVSNLERLLGRLRALPELSAGALSDEEKAAALSLAERVVTEAEAVAGRGEWEHVVELPRYPTLDSGEPAPGYVSLGVLTAAATMLDTEMREHGPGYCRLNSGWSSKSRDEMSWFLEVRWGLPEVEDYEVQHRVVPVDLVLSLEFETLQIKAFHAEVDGEPVHLGALGPLKNSPDGRGLEQRMRVLAVLPRSGRNG